MHPSQPGEAVPGVDAALYVPMFDHFGREWRQCFECEREQGKPHAGDCLAIPLIAAVRAEPPREEGAPLLPPREAYAWVYEKLDGMGLDALDLDVLIATVSSSRAAARASGPVEPGDE